jgi:hypothetical protein
VAEERDEDRVHRLRQGEDDDRDRHRRAQVLSRVEAGRQDLDADEADQADAVAAQRERGLRRGEGVELAALEEGRDERLGKDEQRRRARQREDEREAQPPVEHLRIGSGVAAALRRGELRDQHGAERDAEERRRELHQPVGVEQPRHRADALVRRDLRVDEDRELRDRDAEQRRRHLLQDRAHTRMAPRGDERAGAKRDARQHAEPPQRRHLQRELEDAAEDDACGERVDALDAGAREQRDEPPHRCDHGDVEEDGSRRGDREALPRVEDPRRERDERDEADVREHHPRHHDRFVEMLEPGGHQPDDDGGGGDADDARRDERAEEDRRDRVDQPPGRLVAVGGTRARQHRHERLRERAFAEQAAQQVRDAERDVEGVERRPGAEHRRDDDVAHQPGDPRRQREERDRRRRAEQIHGRSAVLGESRRDGADAILTVFSPAGSSGAVHPQEFISWPPLPKPRRRPSASPRASSARVRTSSFAPPTWRFARAFAP